MKYAYEFKVEENEADLLELKGAGSTRSKIAYLKSIRKEINDMIRDEIENAKTAKGTK